MAEAIGSDFPGAAPVAPAPKFDVFLQIALSLESIYTMGYVPLLLGLLLYKSSTFVYPPGVVVREAVLILVYPALQQLRCWFGTQGGKAGKAGMIGMFLIFSTFSVLIMGYFLGFQVYVLRLDFIVNVVAISIVLMEVLCGLASGMACAASGGERGMVGLGGLLCTTAIVVVLILQSTDARL